MFATKTFSGELPVLQNAFGAKAKTLDTPAHSSHTLRMQNLQRILYKVMADNNLDALVYPYSTIPPHIVLANRIAGSVRRRAPSRASSRPERNCPIRLYYRAKPC